MKPKFRNFLIACSTLLALPTVHAATLTWDPTGGGTSDGAGAWLDTGKWWNGVDNTTDWTSGDNAIFGNGGTAGNVTLASPTAAGSITLNSYSGTYNLGTSGQALTINGGITKNAGSGAVSFLGPITLGGAQTWTNNSSSTLTTPSGTNFITNGGFDLTFDGTGVFNLGGISSANVTLSGSGNLIKNGTGRLNIGGVNSGFSGTVTVNGGVMQVTNNNNPMGNGNLTLNGGVMSWYWGATYTRTLGTGDSQVQILGGESGFAGSGTTGPSISLGSTVVWGASSEGSATGYFNPSKFVLGDSGTGNAATTTFSSAIDLNGTMRTIAVPKGLSASGNNSTVSGVISSTGAGGALTKEGEGRLILTGNNTYTGNTVLNGGTVRFGNSWSNTWTGYSLDNSSNLEINNSIVEAYYYLTRNLGTGSGEIQLTGGRAGFSNMQGDATGNAFIKFTDTATTVTWGASTLNPSTLVLNDVGASTVLRTQNPFDLNGANRTIEVSATGSGSGRGTYATMEGALSGTGASLTKTGAGTLMLNAANTYDSGTTINGGAVWFRQLTSMPASGAVTVNDGTTLSVGVGGGGQWTTGTSGNGTLGGLLAGLGGQSGGTVSYVDDVNLGLVISGSQTYSGNIADVGTSLGLYVGNKDGGPTSDPFPAGGTLELSGTNTLSGDITVDGGNTLILSGDNSGASGDARIVNGYIASAVANLPSGGLTFDSPGANPAILVGSGTFSPTLGSSGGVFWNNNGGFAATSSALTVTPNAGATLVWNNGTTGFNGKILQLGSPTSTAAVEITNDITINGNYTIRLFDNSSSSADVSVLSGNVARDGASNRNLTVQGSGTLSLTGTNELGTGTLQIDGGVVRAVDGTGLPTACKLNFNGGVLESSGTFTRNIANSAGNVYWNNNGGFAANGGALTVNLAGGSTVDWNVAAGFNGKTLIMGSATADNVVTLQNAILLNNNRTITVNDNPDSSADYAVLSGVIADGSGTRNLTKNGNGKLLLNGVNTYTGLTTVSAGTLGGTGTIAGNVTVAASASLAPGASAGTLSIGGNLDISAPANSTGKLDFELGTIASSDKIAVTGTLTIGAGTLGLSDFNLTDLGGLQNGTYTLISSGTLSGTLNGADVDGTLGAATIQLQTSGNDIVLAVSGLGAGTPYEDWATGGELFGDDANGDGVSNGLAFLLGASGPNVSALDKLPTVTETSGGLVMTFTMLNAASRGTAALNVEHSSDLGISDAWTTVLVPDIAGISGPTNGVTFNVTLGSPSNSVTATIDSSAAASGKLFGRLKATE